MDIGTGIIVSWKAAALAEVVDAIPPASETVSIDTSHHGTVGGRTFMPGDLIDNGELKVDLALVPDALLPIGDSGEAIFTFPDGALWTFDAFVLSNTPVAPIEDRMINSVVFKVSGDVAVTAAP